MMQRQNTQRPSSEIRSLEHPHTAELPPIKGSRFIAIAAPLSSPDVVARILEQQHQRYRGANHHCFAWRIGDSFRLNDDGEPSGTAGRPILQQIDSRALNDTLVIVSRYFGGTKLGTGGLIRAYGSAASTVLDSAPIVTKSITRTLEIRFPYDLTPAIDRILHAHTIERVSGRFDHHVTIELAVPISKISELTADLDTAGRGRITIAPNPTRS